MEGAGRAGPKVSSVLESRAFRLLLLRRIRPRREGSLAAALVQSMALAVMGTAGAYPAWVLVKDRRGDLVLGAAWAITRTDPAPGAALLGSAGGPLMLAIAFCCLFSVLSGSVALTLDFLGRRRCRLLAPLLHGLTAVLIACAAALGSCLLALVRGRAHSEPELRGQRLATSPGQSLFLAFLACALASTATGLSCSSPARVEPARSSWDFGLRHSPALFRYSLPGPRPCPAAASGSSSSSAQSSPSLPGSRFLGTERSSVGSSHVHWKEPSAPGPEEEGTGTGTPTPPTPAASGEEAGGRGWLRRYCDAAWWLLGTLGQLAWRYRGEGAPPPDQERGAPGHSGQPDA